MAGIRSCGHPSPHSPHVYTADGKTYGCPGRRK